MIGLFKAIKNFDNEKQSSFKTFANICVERQLITAIKTSNRQKHIPLNSYLSLNTSAYDNDEESVELIDTFDSHLIEDPLETLMKKEYYQELHSSIDKSLSKFEKQVLDRFVKGESYVTSSVFVSSTGVSLTSSSTVSVASGSSAKSSLTTISLSSILAPICSLVLADLPTLSLR